VSLTVEPERPTPSGSVKFTVLEALRLRGLEAFHPRSPSGPVKFTVPRGR
jgi:hypothetical protein